jgi:hypothetical protein
MNSRGEVKIVIIILVKPAQSMLHIEKWILAPVAGTPPNSRPFSTLNVAPPPPQISTKIHEITIIPNTVTGNPLVLEFAKIFLRPAIPPETDFILTGQELAAWAANFW